MAPPYKAYGRYGTVGLELLLSIIIGWAAGRWVDRHVGGHGYATAAGVVVGLYAGFRAIFKAGKMLNRDAERADEDEKERLKKGEDDE